MCHGGWVGRIQLILRFKTGSLVIANARCAHDADVDGLVENGADNDDDVVIVEDSEIPYFYNL